MRLGTISIGGRTNFTIMKVIVEKDLTGRNSTATVRVFAAPFDNVQYDSGAQYDGGAVYDNPVAPEEMDEIIIEDDGAVRVFAGYITSVDEERLSKEGIIYNLKCLDYNLLLDTTIVTTPTIYAEDSISDRGIIQDVFSTYLPEITTLDANIEIVKSLMPEFETTDLSLAEVMRRLADLVDAEYRVDQNKAMHWFTPGNNLAIQELSDNPHSDNEILYSEDYTQTEWTKLNCTVNANAISGPMRTDLTGDKLEEDTATGDHSFEHDSITGLTNSTPYTFSVFVKAVERTKAYIGWTDGGFVRVWFDLALGTVLTEESGITGMIDQLSDGWYRLSVTRSNSGTSCQPQLGCAIADASTSYTGTTGSGMYVYGAQFEEASLAGFYGVTTGSAIAKAVHYNMRKFGGKFEKPANKVTVLGGLDGNGDEVTATVSDATSIATYSAVKAGGFHAVVVDRNIPTTAAATLRGEIELVRRANPAVLVSLITTEDGFEVGEQVVLNNHARGLVNETFVIRKLKQSNESLDGTVYELELGPPIRDIFKLLQKLGRIVNPDPIFPSVGHGPNSVGSTELKDGAVVRLKLALLAVDTAQIEIGAIEASVIAANAITSVAINDDAITAPKILAGAVIAGKLAAGAVIAGTIAAGIITGVEIQAGSITALDAVFATGAIGSADIGTAEIKTANIDSAAITNAKIGNLAVDTAQIANAAITNLKIDTIQASKITAGTISAAVSMTSPTIISTSGSNVVTLTGGGLDVDGATFSAALTAGRLVISASGQLMNLDASNFTFATGTNTMSLSTASGSTLSLTTSGNSVAVIGGTGVINLSGSYQIDGVDVIDSSKVYVGSGGVDTSGDINTNGKYEVDGSIVISTAGAFVGAGVDVGSDGISCGGYAFDGGFFGVSATFDIANGDTVTVKGGIITSIV